MASPSLPTCRQQARRQLTWQGSQGSQCQRGTSLLPAGGHLHATLRTLSQGPTGVGGSTRQLLGWSGISVCGRTGASVASITERDSSRHIIRSCSVSFSGEDRVPVVPSAPSPFLASSFAPLLAHMPMWPSTRQLWPPSCIVRTGRGSGKTWVCTGERRGTHLSRGRRAELQPTCSSETLTFLCHQTTDDGWR